MRRLLRVAAKVRVPLPRRFTFTCMEPNTADDRGDPLTVTFDDVQGPHRRRMALTAVAAVVVVLALIAAWRLEALPHSAPPDRAVPLSKGVPRRRPLRLRGVGPLVHPRPPGSPHRRIPASTKRFGRPQSAIAPTVIPKRLEPAASVGPVRPLSKSPVGHMEHRQFQYLGR